MPHQLRPDAHRFGASGPWLSWTAPWRQPRIQVYTPAQQEGEIHIAIQHPAVIAPFLRLYCESSDQGNRMQEENNVADKGIGNSRMLINLDIRPDKLPGEP